MLITNSDWLYTNTMMHATYDPFLPDGMGWQDLFSIVVVSACKPEFFDATARRPVYQIANADGMLREGYKFEVGQTYAGGYAQLVEKCLHSKGAEVLYIGDHLFTDVNMAKRGFGWRTCMILQELEAEMAGALAMPYLALPSMRASAPLTLLWQVCGRVKRACMNSLSS